MQTIKLSLKDKKAEYGHSDKAERGYRMAENHFFGKRMPFELFAECANGYLSGQIRTIEEASARCGLSRRTFHDRIDFFLVNGYLPEKWFLEFDEEGHTDPKLVKEYMEHYEKMMKEHEKKRKKVKHVIASKRCDK